MRLFLYISLLLLSNAAFAKTTNHSVMLGETKVTIQHIKYGEGKEFVHVHQNENTALLAAKKYIKKYGGSIVTLKHHGTRNITFNMHNTRYEFDPNRIYTDIGIKNTLKNYGEYSLEAHQAVNKLSHSYPAKRLLQYTIIMATHSTTTCPVTL